jgi:hypothetical protein
MRLAVAAAIVLVLAAGCGSDRPASKAAPATRPSPVSRIQGACLQRNDELHQLSRPRSRAEFAGYVASLLNIVRYYRGQLAALHPSDGRQYFARYRRLIRADEASAVAMLMAVRQGKQRTVGRLVTQQRSRSAVEQALLRRLGVSC